MTSPPRPAPRPLRTTRNHRRIGLFAIVVALLTGVLTAGPAPADPPPNPLLWQRTYVPEIDQSPDAVRNEIVAECHNDLDRGLRENGSGGPRIAAIGDSVQSQMRGAAMGDPAIHWMYGSHCGEKFGTAVDSGRVADAVNSHPDVLLIGLGGNDLSDFWQVRPDLLPTGLANLQRVLDATDSVPCRVLYTLPDVAPFFAAGQEQTWLAMTSQMNNAIRAAQSRPGVRIADWAQILTATGYWPAYLADGMHLTRKGINAKMNVAIEAARGCWAPDTPTNAGAVAGNGTATVWWDPLPAAEKTFFYLVTASDGRTVTSFQPTVNFPGLTNGVAYRFKVQAISFAGASTPTALTPPVTPSAAGARFHAVSPSRVLDTRDGTGGKGTSFGPGESYKLSLNGTVPAGASAAVLNITAVGQTAPTFITAWPGGQSRPLSSNLNPQPGIAAVPAMVTTRVAADGSIQLFNNAGNVHLIADVIGWYGAIGDATGSLYAPVAPVRVLDTRDGTGGKSGKFGTGEQLPLTLPLPAGASAAVLNVTATDVTAPSHITVWPEGDPKPVASSLNPQPGVTRANLTVSKVDGANAVRIFNNSASTNLIVDLVGYYTAPGALTGGAAYFPITPERVYDTRDGTGGLQGPVGNGSNTALSFAGKGAIPATGVSAVDANVTVVGPSAGGHTSVWPSGAPPVASVLNYGPGDVVANRDNVTLAGSGALVWSAAPSIQYVIDTAGWFGPTL